jgi:hypothetical protein
MGPTELPNGRCIELNSNADKRFLEILEEKIAFLTVPILYVHLGFHADEDTD